MTYSKINITDSPNEVSGFSFKLLLLLIAIVATIGVNVLVFNSNQTSNIEANDSVTPFTTEMVILVK